MSTCDSAGPVFVNLWPFRPEGSPHPSVSVSRLIIAPKGGVRETGGSPEPVVGSLSRYIPFRPVAAGDDRPLWRCANSHVPMYLKVGLPSVFLPVPVTLSSQRTRGPAI